MELGFIGLGKMGMNMVERLLLDKHKVVAYSISETEVAKAKEKGATASASINDMLNKLQGERKIIWLMVPSGKAVDENLDCLLQILKPNDIVIDGGNSFWKDSVIRSERALNHKINYIDCGTSGGVWGLQNGYCLMYGGNKEACDYIDPILKSLAPDNGKIYCGKSGSGHFVKMVHNGIEYGMMQAYAEGFELMKESGYNLNLEEISKVWMNGSVVRSWLLELIGDALSDNPDLDNLKAYVEDNGEARWMINTAVEKGVPVDVIAASLFSRFKSRQDNSFAMKLLAAMRNQFGGHSIKNQ